MGKKASLWALAAVLVFPLLASACKCNDGPPPSPVPPDIEQAVRAYFGAWEAGDFEEMSAFMAREEEGGQDFAEDMSFAPVTPKNLEIRAAETLSPNRVRVEYSLDLPELKYIVAGIILRNPARHPWRCVTLNEEQTRYTSYQDFLVLEREGADAPWKVDGADGNTLAKAVWMMNFTFLFYLTYGGALPDPSSPEFDENAFTSTLAVYATVRGVEEDTELIELGVPVVQHLIDLADECK